MIIRIPEGKSRLMVVEGKEDQEFFIKLATHLSVIDGWPLQIEQLDGKGNFREFLLALTRHPRFGKLTSIGIVRDADFGTDSFQSVRDTIRSANEVSPRHLPVPKRVLEFAQGTPKTGVLILPSGDREGMIENLIMDIFDEDPVAKCVDNYVECLIAEGQSVSQAKLPKARLRTFISGKNIGMDAEGDDSDRPRLSDVFHMSWWKPEYWDHPAFDDAKAFLHQLLTD